MKQQNKKIRILILDDQPGRGQFFAWYLRSAGFSVAEYTCPHEALKNIREVDILVTDSHMPGMTGLEVARRAYAKDWKGALFIMCGHVAMIVEGVEDPLLGKVLEKPFSMSQLMAKMRNLA